MKRFEKRRSPLLQTAIALSLPAVFILDVLTPLGVAEWVFYLIPVTLTLYLWRPRTPLLVAAACTALIVAGVFLSPQAPTAATGLPTWVPRLNRLLVVSAIWVVAFVARRFVVTKLKLVERDWVRTGQAELSARMQGEQSLSQLGDGILRYLCEYLGIPVAALYAADQGGVFRRKATYALGGTQSGLEAPESVAPGETLLGQAIKDNHIVRVDDLPGDYLTVASALGKATPAHLLVVPTQVGGTVNGALEFGFLHRVGDTDLDLLRTTAPAIAMALRSAQYRARQAELLEETQRQAKALQLQQEELRVSNEELQDQSRALQESQARLEAQQAELEQSNSQLADQTQALERQRDELSRAQMDLVEKAEALARANQYKSEFLANMSHELRTPLNSALILAKLLADNKDANLSPEQVKYASTIYSSGNDLLTLINDILDLSRIEAGRVEIAPEELPFAALTASLKKTFQPLAAQRQLTLDFAADPDVPEAMKTDPLRLQQILRNLLSNAIKFTERGGVALRIRRAEGDRIAFAVSDTGIGIPADQHEAIFDAFRQADGTTHRKYGGTGLGLTISRELTKRLGGTLTVSSEVGQGSTFTLTVPLAIEAGAPAPALPSTAAPAPIAALRRREPGRPKPPPRADPQAAAQGPRAPARAAAAAIADDRDAMARGDRSILVIEDDEKFAAILRDLARELRFRCLVATSAGEGRELAERFAPSGILLDVHLPDQSGLSLLEQLKRDPATRHIPVHVVSVVDYTRQALELGAVGYALKPVEREQVVDAIARLEKKLEQRVRRVLVVEDVPAQRESIEALLRREGVEIVSVGLGREALERLRAGSFDCMVLDLALPDMSGYQLLETIAAGEEAFAFPPVVVYTGRALSREEELRLRRFASSVIIKGARSPERLLDEVSLFLHQVESKLPPEQQRILRLVRQRESAFEGRTILVVEDDARNIFALSSILEPKGARLLIARNGREALERLEGAAKDPAAAAVDLVLMDIMMPVMDGLAATREIRRRPEWRGLPIIALTAKAMSDDRLKCIEAGANDYIAKPLDVDKLVSLVKVWLPK